MLGKVAVTYPEPVVPVARAVGCVGRLRGVGARGDAVTIALVGARGGRLAVGGGRGRVASAQVHTWTVQGVIGTR